MLPSVTDVVRELAKAVSADPAVLFRAARGIVAEELAKVKQGFESAPLDVLVKRARFQLEREGTAKPVSGPAPPFTPVFPPRPRVPPATEKEAPAQPRPSDDPFEDAPSRAELGWEKEISIHSEDAPFRSAILPIPRVGHGPTEIFPPSPAASPRPEPEPKSEPEPTAKSSAAGPGPEPVLPKSAPAEPRPEVASALTIPLARFEEPELPAPSVPLLVPQPELPAPPEPPPAPPPTGAERFLREPSPPPAAHEPAVKSMSEMAPLREMFDDKTEPAVEEFHFKESEPAPEPARSNLRGWLAAIALVLAIGAGLAWAVREYVFRSEIVKSVAPAPRKKIEAAPPASAAPAPTAAPAAVAEPAAPLKAPPVKPAAAPARPAEPAPAAAPVPKGKAALLLTPDWAGKAPVYVIHFSSLKDRESAAKEAKKLGAALGAPARAVEVDLGEKGVWYRVVVGEFPDVEAARAFRADLEAKKTPGMGFVYEMRGR
jgi:hypothetical protein